jgi:hypothetical protein
VALDSPPNDGHLLLFMGGTGLPRARMMVGDPSLHLWKGALSIRKVINGGGSAITEGMAVATVTVDTR